MSTTSAKLRDFSDSGDRIEHRTVLEPRDAVTRPASKVLPEELAERFPYDLYTHQAEALTRLGEDENVCVSTSTSSGKTYIYGLEIARQFLKDPSSTALIIHPTKALSADQKTELEELYDQLKLDVEVGVYDGDTSADRKREIRDDAAVVITNFAGLNFYLPHHRKWDRVLRNLKTVVVEEAHAYGGVLGMHAAWILRRLFRLTESERYRSKPRVILTSATIGNPANHAERLTGKSITVVDDDGSPRGAREILLWNPPKLHEDTEHRQSPHKETSKLLAHLADANNQILTFTSSRKMTELTTRWTLDRLNENGNDSPDRIESYHAGHSKTERTAVEDRLKESSLDGVVSTSALELGVNIGGVDGTILCGYPGSRQRFWQRLGRSGRDGKRALNVMVARESALDQYIMRNPEYLLDEDVEDAVLDLDNNTVFLTHLRIAAHELPLTEYDEVYFGDRLEQGVDFLKKTGDCTGRLESKVHYNRSDRPETEVDLYGSGRSTFEVTLTDENDNRRTLDSKITAHRAYRDFHPGAIYIHKGRQYEVTDFQEDPKSRVELESVDVDYYTSSTRKPNVSDVEARKSRQLGDYDLHWGFGEVEEYFPFYKRKDIDSQTVKETLRTGLEDPVVLNTHLLWLTLPEDRTETVRNRFDPLDLGTDSAESDPFLGGIHAIEHGLVHMAPTELLIDKGDLGGLSVNDHPETGRPTIFLYDAVDGGLGFTRSIYGCFRSLSERTATLIETCDCDGFQGCPSCVMDYRCGNNNSPLHTDAAVFLLADLLSAPSKG